MMRTCVNFVAAGGTCRAGVAVEALRDDELRLPCVEINERTGKLGCDERAWPAPPAAAPLGRMAALLEAVTQGRCPSCNEPMRGEVQVGDKTYATPCRHVIRSGPKEPQR